jgi:hypothetical protein
MALTQAIAMARHPFADSSYKQMLIDGKWLEYVAPRVMLRICDWVLSHRRLTVSRQHNASALREVA